MNKLKWHKISAGLYKAEYKGHKFEIEQRDWDFNVEPFAWDLRINDNWWDRYTTKKECIKRANELINNPEKYKLD